MDGVRDDVVYLWGGLGRCRGRGIAMGMGAGCSLRVEGPRQGGI